MLVTCGDASEVFGFVEEAFDEAALRVDVGIMVDTHCPAATGGGHGLSTGLVDRGPEMIGIISPVGKGMAG